MPLLSTRRARPFPGLRLEIPPRAACVIAGRLFLSDACAAEDAHLLRRLHVTHVVDASNSRRLLRDGSSAFGSEAEKELELDNGSNETTAAWPVKRLEVRLNDDAAAAAQMAARFADVVEFINAARSRGEATLVHCQHGISRSATLVLAYLMIQERMTLAAAIEHVRQSGACPHPNPGFMRVLIDLEKDLFGSCSLNEKDFLISELRAERMSDLTRMFESPRQPPHTPSSRRKVQPRNIFTDKSDD